MELLNNYFTEINKKIRNNVYLEYTKTELQNNKLFIKPKPKPKINDNYHMEELSEIQTIYKKISDMTKIFENISYRVEINGIVFTILILSYHVNYDPEIRISFTTNDNVSEQLLFSISITIGYIYNPTENKIYNKIDAINSYKQYIDLYHYDYLKMFVTNMDKLPILIYDLLVFLPITYISIGSKCICPKSI